MHFKALSDISLAQLEKYLRAPSNEKRVALILANSDYLHHASLPSAHSDAKEMRRVLGELGFQIIGDSNDTGENDLSIAENFTNLDRPSMLRAFELLRQGSAGAKIALIYYSGHGMNISGNNYIVTTECSNEATPFLLNGEPLHSLVRRSVPTDVNATLLILDCCRSSATTSSSEMGMRQAKGLDLNPVGGHKEVGQFSRPMTEMDVGHSAWIAYAAAPGDKAYGGEDGRCSPFTAALVEHIATPGLEVRELLRQARRSVQQSTGGLQNPWDTSSLAGQFYFWPILLRPIVLLATAIILGHSAVTLFGFNDAFAYAVWPSGKWQPQSVSHAMAFGALGLWLCLVYRCHYFKAALFAILMTVGLRILHEYFIVDYRFWRSAVGKDIRLSPNPDALPDTLVQLANLILATTEQFAEALMYFVAAGVVSAALFSPMRSWRMIMYGLLLAILTGAIAQAWQSIGSFLPEVYWANVSPGYVFFTIAEGAIIASAVGYICYCSLLRRNV